MHGEFWLGNSALETNNPHSREPFRINPIECFTPNRLDLIFKFIYGQSVLSNSKAKYPKRVYKNHLFSITGRNGKFIEYGNIPRKEGFQVFDETFQSLLKADAKSFPPVNLDQDFKLNNGAHRTVAALLQNETISAVYDEKPRGIDASYLFFKKASRWRYRLSQIDLDYALLKFSEINSNVKLLVVYPSMKNENLIEELRGHQEFFLERNFRLRSAAKWKLLDFLYPEPENFVNLNPRNLENAFRDRFNLPGRLRIFFFYTKDVQFTNALKLNLRSKYNLPTGSIHTPEHREEALALLEVLLNKNSRQNIHNFNLGFASQVKRSLNEMPYNTSEIAVVGSSPLALLNIRNSKDLDIICRPQVDVERGNGIDIHNPYWEKMGFNIDEILDNPNHFMLVNGVKYISKWKLIRFKILRRERKDVLDVCRVVINQVKSSFLIVFSIKHFIKGHLRIARNWLRAFAR